MPRKRDVSVGEIVTMAMFDRRVPVDKISAAFLAGQKVEIEESSFSDPGGDYTAILIDGRSVYRKAGY